MVHCPFTRGIARRATPVVFLVFLMSMLLPTRLRAAEPGAVTETVLDQLGGAVSATHVSLAVRGLGTHRSRSACAGVI